MTNSEQTNGPTQSFAYDANGNRLNVTTDGTPISYSYTSGTNRLAQVGATARGYDGAGNTATDGTRIYLHNAPGDQKEARSGAATLARYRHDHRHRRTYAELPASQSEQTYTYDLDGNRIATGILTRPTISDISYLYADGEPIAMIDRPFGAVPETLTYLHPDHLGAPRLATSTTGTPVWKWRGTAFGENGINDDPDGDGIHVTLDLRHPGQWFDAETGLFYNHHRTYEPATGRYLQSDPIGLAGGLNTYAYALSNPLRFSDPTGQAIPAVIWGIGESIAWCSANPACRTGVLAIIGAGVAKNSSISEPADSDTNSHACEKGRCKYSHFEKSFQRQGDPPIPLSGGPEESYNVFLTCVYVCPEGEKRQRYFFTRHGNRELWGQAFVDPEAFCKVRTP